MLKDKIVTGVIIGILANTLKLISNYVMFYMGLTNVVFWQITATRFLKKDYLFKPTAYVIGAIADITVTSFLGIVFILFIYYFGEKFLLIKSIGYGMFVWVTLFGTLLSAEVQQKVPQDPSGIIVTIIAHFIYGLGFTLFTRLLYNKKNYK